MFKSFNLKRLTQAILAKRDHIKVLALLSDDEKALISEIRKKKLTYLSESKLVKLIKSIQSLKEVENEGIFIEAGCALGGSAILISRFKNEKTPLYIYDVFGIIPPPTKEDTEDVHQRYKTIIEGKSKGISGDKYYGYENDLYKTVQSNFDKFSIDRDKESIFLIKGFVQETMKLNEPVAFAHIDVDWYSPVKHCLEQIFPKLVKNGCIILDDYFDWGGCRKATDEFLRNTSGGFILDDTFGSRKIIKKF